MSMFTEFFTSIAHAQIGQPPDVGLPGDNGATALPDLIGQVINWFLVLVGVLALGFIVYGGFLYITSHGDENQVEQAKKIITYAVIGIVMIGISYAVVQFVISAFE